MWAHNNQAIGTQAFGCNKTRCVDAIKPSIVGGCNNTRHVGTVKPIASAYVETSDILSQHFLLERQTGIIAPTCLSS